MKPYGIISDTHHHNWSQFASTTESGVNTRLQVLLDETMRAAKVVSEAGGNTIYHAGDLFHVRGSVAPSVFNPTREVYNCAAKLYGVKFVLLPGNHDMEHKHSNAVGNAVEMMRGVHVDVIENVWHDNGMLLVPWIENIDQLRTILVERHDKCSPEETDVIIHAPIDGVLGGIPPHGLTPGWLGDLGYRRIFSGHYHHHKAFDEGVYSIGAIAHHTFGDIYSEAGFLLVKQNDVEFMPSQAPRFVQIDGGMNESTIAGLANGNYVRAKTSATKTADINALREFLKGCGAQGIVIDAVKEAPTVRTTNSTIKSGASLEQSINDFVGDFVKTNAMPGGEQYAQAVSKAALNILSRVA